MQNKRDYYDVLGVPKGADAGTIKKSYRKLALKHHPDRNPGNAEAEMSFKEASEAFQVLSDSEKRRLYDQFGFEGLEGAGYTGVGGMDDIFTHFEDLFGDFFGFGFGSGGGGGGGGGMGFGGRRSGPVPQSGRSIRKVIELSLEEAAFGCKKEIDFRVPNACEVCDGTGSKKGTHPQTCPTCGGQGQVARSQGVFVLTTACPHCEGRRTINPNPCNDCSGAGRIMVDRTMLVSVPAGIDDGQSIRIPNQGEPGELGGPPGHLYVEVHVQPDGRFERREYDLITEAFIFYPTAVLGGKITVATLEGETRVKVPVGSQPNDIMTVKGEGIPILNGSKRGDLHVVLRITVPKSVSRKEKKLLNQLLEMQQKG